MAHRKTRLAISGFGPFDGIERNSTEDLIAVLDSHPQLTSRFELSTKVFPVVYKTAQANLRSLFDTVKPQISILTGVCQGISQLNLERCAHNLDDSPVADNQGVIRIQQVIDAQNPIDKYRCRLPVEDFAAELRQSGIATSVSDHGGGYICNHYYFIATQICESSCNLKAVIFVHIPDFTSNTLTRRVNSIETVADGVCQLACLIDKFIEHAP